MAVGLLLPAFTLAGLSGFLGSPSPTILIQHEPLAVTVAISVQSGSQVSSVAVAHGDPIWKELTVNLTVKNSLATNVTLDHPFFLVNFEILPRQTPSGQSAWETAWSEGMTFGASRAGLVTLAPGEKVLASFQFYLVSSITNRSILSSCCSDWPEGPSLAQQGYVAGVSESYGLQADFAGILDFVLVNPANFHPPLSIDGGTVYVSVPFPTR